MFDNFKSQTPEHKTLNSKNIDYYDKIINSNLLYITHEIDQIKKIVIGIQNNLKLQKQVDDYFEERQPEHIPEEEK